jgi:hypothetical protein
MKSHLLFVMCIATLQASALDLSTLDGTTLGGVPVTYNQWLASSVIASSDVTAAFVSGIAMEVICLVPNSNIFVAITGSNGGRPDLHDIRVVMDTTPLYAPVHLGSTEMVSLTPAAAYTTSLLDPGQEYWVVFGSTAPDFQEGNPSGLYEWNYKSDHSFPNADGWSIGNRVAAGGTGGQNWVSEINTPYGFSVSLVPVPEPSVLSLLAASSIMLRRRRQTV